MSSFTEAELDQLGQHRLGAGGHRRRQRHPARHPVGMWWHNAERHTVDVTGREFDTTKKYREVERGRTRPS